ncbi:hypothetical protein C8J56DRAFT_781077, partial [Mycena floridula]
MTNPFGTGDTFGGTITNGIQDISALLPLLGTEQCSTHVGSALTGGFLYPQASILSLFGSLGIVQTGITTLISSMSWNGRIGAKKLLHAGFMAVGTVTPLICLEPTLKERYLAETRIIELLDELHLNNPDLL